MPAASQRPFEPVIDAHWRKILNLAVRMTGDRVEGEEIAQETFFRAYRAWPKFAGRSSVLTWLFRIAVNTTKAHMLERHRRGSVSLSDAPPPAVRDRDPIEAREEREHIEAAMQAISPKHRMVLTLFCQEGLNHEQIAEVVGCPIGTVWSRLYNARAAFARQLEQTKTEIER
ncbi:MAG: sigma-70 family RNA polymerase sigma factor [Planctomycetota bacterium]|nr:sigma-70 family RNA polymerase sigma factor [Planctomycetota bacterium]